MFSKLLKSEARKKLLKIFTENSRQKYYLRELAGMIQYSPGSLQRELNSLVSDDILLAERVGNLRFFGLNTKNPYIKDLKLYLASHPDIATPVEPKEAKETKKLLPIKSQSSPKTPKQPQKAPPSPGMKAGTKPVLEMRPRAIQEDVPPAPAPVVPSAPAPVPAPAPVSFREPPLRETFSPAPAPIQPPVAYPDMIQPFSKPVLTKPDLPRPEYSSQDSKPKIESDYSSTQSEPSFDYTQFSPSEPAPSFADAPATESGDEPLAYQPEPTIQKEPPEEASGDIRLHID